MKVAIIGAGRTRNGIGEYIGKYFHQQGGKVSSVLGTTKNTSSRACLALRKYGIDARPYTDFNEMVKIEMPDAVVIASPSTTHHEYLLKATDSGLHIFCEKPFIWGDLTNPPEKAEEIFSKAKEKKLTIAMNSQWPFAINDYEKICGKPEIKNRNTFTMKMAPSLLGREMISESVPHALSLLYCLFGGGEIEALNFESGGEREKIVRFTYRFGNKLCKVFIRLVYQETQPRDFSFGLNDRVIYRSLDLENYEIYFQYGNRKIKVMDPLESSVKNFMEAVAEKKEPLIGARHIYHTLSLLKKIDDGFGEFEKRKLWKR